MHEHIIECVVVEQIQIWIREVHVNRLRLRSQSFTEIDVMKFDVISNE